MSEIRHALFFVVFSFIAAAVNIIVTSLYQSKVLRERNESACREMQTFVFPKRHTLSEAGRINLLKTLYCRFLCDDGQDGSRFDNRVLDALESVDAREDVKP